MIELTGAVAELRALVTEEPTLPLEELTLAMDEDEEIWDPIEEMPEAGIVVATPPMVVVMRLELTEVVEVDAETSLKSSVSTLLNT
jgi:hypothetical protein